MPTPELKTSFNGKPIAQNFSHQTLGTPSVIVQHNYSSHFGIYSYFDPKKAVTGEFCVAIFRVRPRKN